MRAGMALIGPNCSGFLTGAYKGKFAGIVPKLPGGAVDFISGSGATVDYVMECAEGRGLSFGTVLNLGNSAQMGVEDLLQLLRRELWAGLRPDSSALYGGGEKTWLSFSAMPEVSRKKAASWSASNPGRPAPARGPRPAIPGPWPAATRRCRRCSTRPGSSGSAAGRPWSMSPVSSRRPGANLLANGLPSSPTPAGRG